MPTIILDGRELAKNIEREVARRAAALREMSNGRVPTLATVMVGDDPASLTYVGMKGRACQRVGMDSRRIVLPGDMSTEAVVSEIRALNRDEGVDGILLQHPVPHHIDERRCFEEIDVEKDVDGVTAVSYGRMAMGMPAYGSATPAGIMQLLRHYEIPLEGKHAVVVGRSPILGKPMAAMLLNADATVTVCHSRTRELVDIIRDADIVVGAVGKPEFIKADWIREGAVVVDAGYHPATKVGDVELARAAERCAAYTPVPGGVGPMTIATLIQQTMEAAEKKLARRVGSHTAPVPPG